MCAKKLFATDFDGTLNVYPEGVTEECLKKITEFRNAGNYFGIITGRTFTNSENILNGYLKYCDFFMCMTGAYAIDGEGNFLFESKGDRSVLPALIETILDEGCQYLYVSDKEYTIYFDQTKAFSGNREILEEMDKFESFSQVNTCFSPEEHLNSAVAHIREKFSDKINPQLNGNCVDIPPAGVSKGSAVLRMAKHFGVPPENIFTAGDNNNDLSMIEQHYGYTVPYGTPEMQKAAKKIMANVGEMLDDVMKNH